MTSDEVINDSGWRIVKEQLRSAFVDVPFAFEDAEPEFYPYVDVLRTAFDEGPFPFEGNEAAQLPADRDPYIAEWFSAVILMDPIGRQYTMPRLLVIVTEEQSGGGLWVPDFISLLNVPCMVFNENEVAKSMSAWKSSDVREQWIRNLRLTRRKVSVKSNDFVHFTPDQIAAIRSWLEYIWDTEDLREQDSSGELPSALMYWRLAAETGHLP